MKRTTPIFGVSANVLPKHVEACLAAGMDDHIPIQRQGRLDERGQREGPRLPALPDGGGKVRRQPGERQKPGGIVIAKPALAGELLDRPDLARRELSGPSPGQTDGADESTIRPRRSGEVTWG